MKKILILIFFTLSTYTLAEEKNTTFNQSVFNKAQEDGVTVVINSWNKYCLTCKKQFSILKEAKKEFPNVLFLSFEQTKDKNIADLLKIDYWSTIVIYKNKKELFRTIGLTKKSEIYTAIKKNI